MNPEQNGSFTNGHLALQYFTNRHKFTRQFVEYLNNELPPTKILFFHGDGGNGKSLLLKFLRENCCKHFTGKGRYATRLAPLRCRCHNLFAKSKYCRC